MYSDYDFKDDGSLWVLHVRRDNTTIGGQGGGDDDNDPFKELIWIEDEKETNCNEHEWIGSGVPGGQMWCRHCDQDRPNDKNVASNAHN